MAIKKETKTKEKLSQPLLIVGILLGLSVLLNVFLYQRANNLSTYPSDPTKNINSKYQELLKSMPENKAQDELISWFKKDPLVIKVEKNNDSQNPGINADYCIGSRGGMGDSWYNLKTVK